MVKPNDTTRASWGLPAPSNPRKERRFVLLCMSMIAGREDSPQVAASRNVLPVSL